MVGRLNTLNDLQTKKSLYQPPEIDLLHHRRLADHCAGERCWAEKLDFATSGPAKLTEAEFHYFQLYRPEISQADIAAYAGKARQMEMHDLCNSPYWIATSDDKALLELILTGADLPVARTIAIFAHKPRSGFAQQLRTRQDVFEFISEAPYPVFCKPIDGMFGIGAMKIDGLAGDKVQLAGREPEAFSDFFDYISKLSISGFLFQTCIKQAQSVTEIFGPAVCSVRFLVLNGGSPQIESAVMKMGGAGTVADNFWQTGNLLAAVDMSGRVSNFLQNINGKFEAISVNPITGRTMDGFSLENWAEAVELITQAAALFPLVQTQSWDIAMTDEGPTVLEYNWGGDLNLHQLAHKRGVLSQSYLDHLKTCRRSELYTAVTSSI